MNAEADRRKPTPEGYHTGPRAAGREVRRAAMCFLFKGRAARLAGYTSRLRRRRFFRPKKVSCLTEKPPGHSYK
jgi:hypothetical protein